MAEGKIYCIKCFYKYYGSLDAAMLSGKKVNIFIDPRLWRCSECGALIHEGYVVYEEDKKA